MCNVCESRIQERKEEDVPRGTVIVLNGTTSAGKTTIGRALQEVMDEPYLLSGFDHFQPALPPGLLTITDDPNVHTEGIVAVYGEAGLLEVRSGPLARQLSAGVHRAMAALSDAGLNVIVDTVIVDQSSLEAIVSIFRAYPGYFVCVDVSLAAAERRERERGDRGPGNVRYFYERVYDLNDIYDLRVDTDRNDPDSSVRMIRRMVETTEPEALQRLSRLREDPTPG